MLDARNETKQLQYKFNQHRIDFSSLILQFECSLFMMKENPCYRRDYARAACDERPTSSGGESSKVLNKYFERLGPID